MHVYIPYDSDCQVVNTQPEIDHVPGYIFMSSAKIAEFRMPLKIVQELITAKFKQQKSTHTTNKSDLKNSH